MRIMQNYCVLDIETVVGKWRYFPRGFNLLMVGLKTTEGPLGEDAYDCFRSEKEEIERLIGFLEGYRGVVVTYNGTRFDVPVLEWYADGFLGRTLPVFEHYDIMARLTKKVRKLVGLDTVARLTLGQGKTPWDSKRNAVIWEEDPDRLIAYNRTDLDITAELFERILQGEPLRTEAGPVFLAPPFA